MGCRGCQVACKQWNDMPAEATHNTGSYTNPPRLSDKTMTLIDFREVERPGGGVDVCYVKHQCMHCLKPACVSACTVGALRQREDGAVVYDSHKCIGCRYCMYACPFGVPAFEWQNVLALIRKCELCKDRTGTGLTPACVKTCPANALHYGTRDAMLDMARRRVYAPGSKYVSHIYGEREIGGTSWMYISTVPFADLGFPTLPETSPVTVSQDVMHATPAIAASLLLGLSGVYWLVRRRGQMSEGAHPDAESSTSPALEKKE
jgi:formate dehydrogenase iron-sulfur subunit